MKYILGIDSGSTKYLARAVSLDGQVLGEYCGGSCSHYDFGAEKAAERINAFLTECLNTFGGLREDCERIVCGTSGYDSPEDGEILNGIYASLPGFTCPRIVLNDVEVAHFVATGGEGILVLSGTGSITHARTQDGREAKVGGWSKAVMGEEGSGRYIDLLCLRHYSRYLDGCRPHTLLLDELDPQLGGPLTSKMLMDYGTMLISPPWPSPGLAPAVRRAALAGDPYANDILMDTAYQLFLLTDETIKLLHMENEPILKIGVWGGVLMNVEQIQQELIRLLQQKYPQAKLYVPERDAAAGAAEIALRWYRQNGTWQQAMQGE